MNTEKKTISVMIKMYCKHHHSKTTRCNSCADLLKYAEFRIDKCHFGINKPACNACPVHCYKPDMRKQVRNVMRWAGPRMIYTHPILAIQHLLQRKKVNINNKKHE